MCVLFCEATGIVGHREQTICPHEHIACADLSSQLCYTLYCTDHICVVVSDGLSGVDSSNIVWEMIYHRNHSLSSMQFLMICQVGREIEFSITVLANMLQSSMWKLMFTLATKCYIFFWTILAFEVKVWVLLFYTYS